MYWGGIPESLHRMTSPWHTVAWFSAKKLDVDIFFSNLVFRFFPAKKKNQTLIMEETKKKITKPVRLVPLTTSKEPLSQRTVPELFSSSGSSQVKASTPTGVEAETSKKLPLAWNSLLKEKPMANQEATVIAASSIEKSKCLGGRKLF